MLTPNYLVYLSIDNYKVCVEVAAENPQAALDIVTVLFKEIEQKVGQVRVADAGTGFFIRGFS